MKAIYKITYPYGKIYTRDAAFIEQVRHVLELYVRDLPEEEQVWLLDEKTNMQPRPRGHRTRPACPTRPVQVEHEYQRAGADTHIHQAVE